MWLIGPDFLRLPECEWPQKSEFEAEEEFKGETVMIITPYEPMIDFSRFSTYTKLLRMMGWINRFIRNCRGPKTFGELTINEMILAERKLVQIAQSVNFQEEIASLECGRKIEKSSPLYQLSPFLDEDRIIRIDGRI